jgi:hypothetical protein
MIVFGFNTPLWLIGKSSRQKIKKETLELNHALNQMYLTNIYRIFQPTAVEYAFFSAIRTFFKMDPILLHKASLNNYKKTEINSCTLSDQN